MFTTRTRHFDGDNPFTLTGIEATTSLHADGFDYDDEAHPGFLSVSAHDVTSLTVDNGQTTQVLRLNAHLGDGRSVKVSLYGIDLDTLAAALAAAAIAKAQVTA
jgi:hypothetical protein